MKQEVRDLVRSTFPALAYKVLEKTQQISYQSE